MKTNESNILINSLKSRKDKVSYDARINWKDLISWKKNIQYPYTSLSKPIVYEVIIRIKPLWNSYFYLDEINAILSALDTIFNHKFYNGIHFDDATKDMVITVSGIYATTK